MANTNQAETRRFILSWDGVQAYVASPLVDVVGWRKVAADCFFLYFREGGSR